MGNRTTARNPTTKNTAFPPRKGFNIVIQGVSST
jgi:hypothetical protein